MIIIENYRQIQFSILYWIESSHYVSGHYHKFDRFIVSCCCYLFVTPGFVHCPVLRETFVLFSSLQYSVSYSFLTDFECEIGSEKNQNSKWYLNQNPNSTQHFSVQRWFYTKQSNFLTNTCNLFWENFQLSIFNKLQFPGRIMEFQGTAGALTNEEY